MILVVGLSIIAGAWWAYDEWEKLHASSAAEASAQAYADTTLYAQLGQQSEETNIPAAGQLPPVLPSVSMGTLH